MDYNDEIEIVYKSIFKRFNEDEQQWKVKYNIFLSRKLVDLETLNSLFALQISIGYTIEQCLNEHREHILFIKNLDDNSN